MPRLGHKRTPSFDDAVLGEMPYNLKMAFGHVKDQEVPAVAEVETSPEATFRGCDDPGPEKVVAWREMA